MSNAIDGRRREKLLEFSGRLGVEFKNLELLNRALTHSSYTKQSDTLAENNEKLEFLGDAVVELTMSAYLFKHFPNASEGELTKLRAALVCQDSLSEVAKGLGFGHMLIVGPSENNPVGRNRPSTLEDAFEAVTGALFLDRGWLVTKKFVERMLSERVVRLKREGLNKDSKSTLQELIPHRRIEYVELRSYGPDHDKRFECAVKIDGEFYGQGRDRTKQRAEQRAAREALKKLEELGDND